MSCLHNHITDLKPISIELVNNMAFVESSQMHQELYQLNVQLMKYKIKLINIV